MPCVEREDLASEEEEEWYRMMQGPQPGGAATTAALLAVLSKPHSNTNNDNSKSKSDGVPDCFADGGPVTAEAVAKDPSLRLCSACMAGLVERSRGDCIRLYTEAHVLEAEFERIEGKGEPAPSAAPSSSASDASLPERGTREAVVVERPRRRPSLGSMLASLVESPAAPSLVGPPAPLFRRPSEDEGKRQNKEVAEAEAEARAGVAALRARLAALEAQRSAASAELHRLLTARHTAEAAALYGGVDEQRGQRRVYAALVASARWLRRLPPDALAFPLRGCVCGDCVGGVGGLRLGALGSHARALHGSVAVTVGTDGNDDNNNDDSDACVEARLARAAEQQQAEAAPLCWGPSVAAPELNAACAQLLAQVQYLAAVHAYSFRRLVLLERTSVVAVCSPLPAAEFERGVSASLLHGVRRVWPAAPLSPDVVSSGTALGPAWLVERNAKRKRLQELHFAHSERRLLLFAVPMWSTFGAACVALLGAVDELCQLIRRKRSLHRSRGKRQQQSCRRGLEATEGEGDQEESDDDDDAPPCRIHKDLIDNFCIDYSKASETQWAMAMKKLVIAVQWCVDETAALEQ